MIKCRDFAGTVGAMAVGLTAALPRNACAQPARTARRKTLHVGGDYRSVALRDVQLAGSICPGFAFGYGYIKALVQPVNSEVRV